MSPFSERLVNRLVVSAVVVGFLIVTALAAAGAWVVQRNLGSDSLHRWMQATLPDDFAVVRAATHKGYRVLRVRHRSGTGQTQAIELPGYDG